MADSSEKVGDLIRERREARGISQSELARRVGTSQQNIFRIEKGEVTHSRYLQKVLAELGLNVGRAIEQTTTVDDVVPANLLVGDKDLPLYGAAEGGEGAIIINFDPIDFIKRPAPLMHVKEGFGLLVVEESMVPAFEPGDIALVNPRLQPRKGKNSIFLSPEDATTVKALIKRFEGQSDALWRVSQWNPIQNFALSKAEWPRCYSVVGKYDAR